MFRLLAVLVCINVAKSANILGVFPFPSISHQIVYQPIWRELSLRGHNVTVITPNPLNDPSLTNLTEIDVSYTYEVLKKIRIQDVMAKDQNVFQLLFSLYDLMDAIVDAQLNNTQVAELIQDQRNHFDLIILEPFHAAIFAFSVRFSAPIIGVSSLGVLTISYDWVGNPTHPVLYPDLLLSIDKNMSLWNKLKSVVFGLWTRYQYNVLILPRTQKMAKKYFGEDIEYVGNLEKNISMLFLNTNPIMFPPRPNVPAIVELGFMHIKPVKELPQDLKKILDEATNGVIYLSLGSNVKSVDMPENLRIIITQTLSELPYLVLWKWESDHFPEQPSNVVTRKWLPQQDVLAHPNVKGFITQGGLQSIEEAISRGVPLIGMPFMGDQPGNVNKIVELEIGLGVDPAIVTKDELKTLIIEVIENRKYKNRIQELRDIALDQPMTSLQKAVFWSEYVIRHKGAKHLRSPTADISWFEYLLVDVVLVLLGASLIGVYLFTKIINSFSRNSHTKLKIA